jgi:hypothetical protein
VSVAVAGEPPVTIGRGSISLAPARLSSAATSSCVRFCAQRSALWLVSSTSFTSAPDNKRSITTSVFPAPAACIKAVISLSVRA